MPPITNASLHGVITAIAHSILKSTNLRYGATQKLGNPQQTPGAPAAGEEEPGGSSSSQAKNQCALCRAKFPVPQLQDRVIRGQVVLVCSDCVTAHPKVLPRTSDTRIGQAGAQRRLARRSGGPGGPPVKRSRLL
eukprot:4290794-Amphidinium_carterae.1